MIIVVRILEVITALGAALYIVTQLIAFWRQRKHQRWLPLLLLLSASEALAAPSISSTSGTFTHGGSVTISGSSFGSKGGTNANKPLIWADFESSADPSSLSHFTTWTLTQNLTRSSAAPQYGVSGWNVKGTWGASSSHSFRVDVSGGVTKFYMYGKRRFTASSQGPNQKFFRVWADNGANTVALTNNSGMAYEETCYNGSRFQEVTLPMNAWNQDEFYWRQSTSGSCALPNSTGNGYYEYIRDGVTDQIYNDNYPTDTTAVYGSSSGNGLRLIDNFSDTGAPLEGTDLYMDDLYLDDTFAHVMIGNASTFSASTQREIQVPTTWSDTSIAISVNRGGFGASASAYLYVIDSGRVVNTNGYAITFGSGGSSVVMFIEWATVAVGVAWHFRKALGAALLASWIMGGGLAALVMNQMKALSCQAAVNTVKITTKMLTYLNRDKHGVS